MNDREFIELLNLYVDHEISAEDALRLEAEVLSNPRRREVYDQYCRMQKACSELAEHLADEADAKAPATVVEFPAAGGWRRGPVFGALAAAAAVALVVGLRDRGSVKPEAVTFAAPVPARVSPVAASVIAQAPSEAMKPILLIGRSPLGADVSRQGPLVLASADSAPQAAPLNWIGDVHMTPVFSTSGKDFLINPKTDLKAAALADPQAGREEQEPAEMAAFRFQR